MTDTQLKKWAKLTEFQEELKNISELEKNNRFGKLISFGTGGMRSLMGAGLNRMNLYTVRLATMGLAKQIIHDDLVRKVVISYDTRHHSKKFAKEAAQTLIHYGIKAYVFKEARPTPMLSYAVRYYEAAAGIMITASHNPKEYNGYKLYGKDGGQLTPEAVSYVRNVMKGNMYSITEFSFENKKGCEYILERIENAYQKELTILRSVYTEKDLSIAYTPLHGTGLIPIQKGLKKFGFNNVYIEPTQATMDGNFPTVDYPNPEEIEAFELAKKLGYKNKAEVLIATDPDADRLGVAILHESTYINLTGNQLGALLLDYKLTLLKEKNQLPHNGMVIKTIVTSELGRKIAESFNLEVIDTLTGFKYISEIIETNFQSKSKKFLFGYEESYGYLLEDFVRDKDAIQAAVAVCEMAQIYKEKDMTLFDRLNLLYKEHGFHKEKLISIELDSYGESDKVITLMNKFMYPTKALINNLKVISVENYLTSERIKMSGESSKLLLPKENVVKYKLKYSAWLCFRPSGTEPKMKIYLGVCAKSDELALSQLVDLEKKVKKLIKT